MKKFNITWTPGDDGGAAITGHDVGYTPSGGSETVVATGSTAAAYTLGGLTDGTEYSVRVRAENSAGKGAWSSAVTQIAALAPEQVIGLAVDATGDGTIDLSWTAPASEAAISDYSVEYTPSGGSATTVLVGSAATSYQLTGLTNDTEYSVRVAAVSAGGTGAYSAAVTGTPAAGPAITVSGSVSGSGTAADPWRASNLNYRGFPYPNDSRTPSPAFTVTTSVSVTILDAAWTQGRSYDGDDFPVHSPIYINGSQVGTIVVDGSLDTRTFALTAGDVLTFGWEYDNGGNLADAMPGGLRVYVE